MDIPQSFRPEKVSDGKMEQLLEGASKYKPNDEIALEGYEKQIFPEELRKLNLIYDQVTTCGNILRELGEKIEGYELKDSPITDDGYRWFWALHFNVKTGKVAVLFPWCVNYTRSYNGLELDRSIAIYITQKVDPSGVDIILEEIYKGLLELKD